MINQKTSDAVNLTEGRAVDAAVDWAVGEDHPHPALQNFLRRFET